jgi:hypothetical protein
MVLALLFKLKVYILQTYYTALKKSAPNVFRPKVELTKARRGDLLVNIRSYHFHGGNTL